MSQVSSLPAPSALPSCAPVSDHARGRARPSVAQTPLSAAVDVYSVFDVLNIFHARWYINRPHILSLALFAQKAGEGNEVTWVEFSPQSHSHLVKQALALAPPSYPLTLVKRVMFSFLLEVVNSLDSTLGQFTKASAPRRRRRTPIPAPSKPPAPPVASVPASRPSALDLVPIAQPSSVMAVDSPSPPPSTLSSLSPTPTPRSLIESGYDRDQLRAFFRSSAPPAPPSPFAGLISKASASESSGATGSSKRPLDPLSPSYDSPHDARAILVPSTEPGQRWTQTSLVAYRAALRDLRVRARIDDAEERKLREELDDAALLRPRQPGDMERGFRMLEKSIGIPNPFKPRQ